jgi:integrase
LSTGLRRKECRTLVRANFDFESAIPTVTAKAKNAKNGKTTTPPLLPDLAKGLKEHMALSLPNAKAFPGM